MQHRTTLVALLGLALLLSLGLALAADGRNLAVSAGKAANRVALVIGNDNYRNVTALQNARADAQAMARALESVGFTVTLKLDADDKAMKEAVRSFKTQLGGGDEAVFYFSGHGVQLGTANYLLPVDIGGENEDQVKDESLPLQRVLDDLQDQKTKFSLAIVDACRNNPFKGKGRAIGGRGLAPTTAATGQMVIYSAGTGQQALDRLGNTDTDPNGLFTRVFLKEMEKPGLPVDRVLRNVRDDVVRLAKGVGHEQVPALYDQAIGDFYFKPGAQVATLAPAPLPEGGGMSLDDIHAQQEARAKWEKWQSAMQADFDKVAKLTTEPDLAVTAWDRFLASYAQDNPFGDTDERLRSEAAARKRQAESDRQRRQAARPAAGGSAGATGDPFRDCADCPEMVPIPGKDYAIGKFEVTQRQWQAVMGSNPSRFKGCADCPVEMVSWNDAQKYIRKLNAKTGKQYRLPSNAEWDNACNAGEQRAFYYCGSDDPDDVAWYKSNSGGKPHPIGYKKPNAFGLYDMSGNVYEWVNDCHNYNNSCAYRVLRGGSWYTLRESAGSRWPLAMEPAKRDDNNGFRLARTLP